MTPHSPLSASDLKGLRVEKGLSQSDIAGLLGIDRAAVSKIETGKRALSESERKILEWYFLGNLPPRSEESEDGSLFSILEFDEAEWRMVSRLSTREGFRNPHQWIASQIRSYLRHHQVMTEKMTEPGNPGARPPSPPSVEAGEDPA